MRDTTTNPESYISPGSEYGLLRSANADRSVWLYALIPDKGALIDGADNAHRLETQQQFQTFFNGLAELMPFGIGNKRDMLKAYYREFHLFTGSVPVPYQIPEEERGTELGAYQAHYYRTRKTRKQFAVIGVRLNPGGSKRKHDPNRTLLQDISDKWNSFAFSIGNGYQPFSDYLADMDDVEAVMKNAGLIPFSTMGDDERERIVAMMETWWVSRPSSNGLPVIAEYDHMHFFPSGETCKNAKRLYDNGVDCDEWNITGEYKATICTVKSSDFEDVPVEWPSALWLARLMEVSTAGGASATAVSVRGTVEPAKVTERELREHARALGENIDERYEKGREASTELLDAKDAAEQAKASYRNGGQPPTVLGSVLACVAGDAEVAVKSLRHIPHMQFVPLNTANQQLLGFKSMQACSDVRLSPYTRHWRSPVISGAGAASFATAGDARGALLGFTEANRQPVYLSPTASADKDRRPAMLVVGDTGSGKSMLLVTLAMQWSLQRTVKGERTPVVLINPKEGDDFEDAVRAGGGTVLRVDSDMADGAFDPFNVLPDPEDAKEKATLMISDIVRAEQHSAEAEIAVAALINYGYKHGARSCGTMLKLAYDEFMRRKDAGLDPGADVEEPLPPNTAVVYNQIMMAVRNYQSLRLIFGTHDNLQPLRTSQGLTLINAGSRSIMPDEGSGANGVTAHIQQWLLCMIILGAGTSVRGRDGVVIVDEAWVALQQGSETGKVVNKWMRLARSQQFMPVLASQKIKEFIDAGLTGGFSRSLLLAMSDSGKAEESPARLALNLLQINDETGVMLRRMKTDAEKGSAEHPIPDGMSLKSLRMDGRTIRGSVAYFKDGDASPVPVEVVVPDELLERISTNRADRLRREQARKERELRDMTVLD